MARQSAPSQASRAPETRRKQPPRIVRVLLSMTRVWMPIGIALIGLAGVVIGGGQDDIIAGAGVSLILVGLGVWMLNWMYRMSVSSNREREREEEARRYFDEHGRWPGE